MKNIFKIRTALLLSIIVLFGRPLKAQSISNTIISFMSDNGWRQSNEYSLPNSSEKTNSPGIMYFDSSYKYAVIAFNETPGIQKIDLKLNYKNGKRYKKDYNIHMIQQLFPKPMNIAMMVINEENCLELTIETIATVSLTKTNTKNGYLFFYR